MKKGFRTISRLLKLISVVWELLVMSHLRRRTIERHEAFRQAFEEMGGVWVKFGQALALRFDILPEAYCYELFKLLNKLEPFPYSQVSQIIFEELGQRPEVLFRSFEQEPFGAASLGQVHRCVLHTGEKV